MTTIKYLTEKQRQVESWINTLGYRTELEVVFGKYCVDIFLPNEKIICEINGFQHYLKERQKRDKYLYDNFDIELIFHFPVDIEYNIFKKIFLRSLNEKGF